MSDREPRQFIDAARTHECTHETIRGAARTARLLAHVCMTIVKAVRVQPIPALLEYSADNGARLLAGRWLQDAQEAAVTLHSATSDNDVSAALHNFHVALRRLRTVLRALQPHLRGSHPRALGRRLGEFTTATGAARDLDRQLAWLRERRGKRARRAQLDALITALQARQKRERRDAIALVSHRFRPLSRRIREQLLHYEVTLPAAPRPVRLTLATAAAEALETQLAALTRRLQDIAEPGDDDGAQAHRARMEGKRLRYLLESMKLADPQPDGLSRLVDQLKGLQDVLGAVHDRHLLLQRVELAAHGKAAGLDVLRAALQRDMDAQLEDYRKVWTAEHREQLATAVRSVMGQLRDTALPYEIERKYLLGALPEAVQQAPSVTIHQGWIPGSRLQESVRHVHGADGDTYFRTIKLGSGLSRQEIEEETTANIFTALWPLTAGKRLDKQRYNLQHDAQLWEIDVFSTPSLVVAEIELDAPDAAVNMPPYLAEHVIKEVTDDGAYTPLNLAH